MKALKILGVVVAVIAALYASSYAKRSKVTLPVEGVVVDSATGKPVEKVFVRSWWHSHSPALVDTTSSVESYGTVTDSQGRFSIPKRNITKVFGRFNTQTLIFQHPLYDFKTTVILDGKNGYRAGTREDGVHRETFKMLTLEEKYPSPAGYRELRLKFYAMCPEFFIYMRDTFSVRYDLETVLANWEWLLMRFPYTDNQEVRRERDSFIGWLRECPP